MAGPAENTHRLSIRRRLQAPREAVYAAWIDQQGIREWMCPGDAAKAESVLDARVGGSFRNRHEGPESRLCAHGIYQVVEPPAKLTSPGLGRKVKSPRWSRLNSWLVARNASSS
jgi:uncharacterized protein YndB with AHSA1/START domain